MSFVKFGSDEEEHHEENVSENKTDNAAKRKRESSCELECSEKPANTSIYYTKRRRPKNVDYKKCKDDLKHLFYVQTCAQRVVPHAWEPNLNVGLKALEDLMDLPKNMYPHCTMTELRPIYIAKKHCDNIDICFRRTIAYEHYRQPLLKARTKFQNSWKNNRQVRKLSKDEVYPSWFFHVAKRLASDPDPFFHGNYDFYYTGGNLCLLSNSATHNVLHVDETVAGALKLSTYLPDEYLDVANLQECTITKLPKDAEIFEVSSLQAMDGVPNLVAARQLNSIAILRINRDENSMKLLVEFQTKQAPLISLAQSVEKPELLVVTTMKQTIRIYDIHRPKHSFLTSSYKMQNENCAGTISGWNRIKRWHGETFLYANAHQLMFTDFRAPQEDWLKTACTISKEESPCEINTCMALSEFENLFYVGTTHKLHCLDARYLKEQTNYRQTSVCEWTHQLDYSPAYLDVYRVENHEYLALAGQLPGDLRVCELTHLKHFDSLSECEFESHCLPWQPPTLQEAYESACLAGKVWQPEAGLKQRVRACTTGLGFFKMLDDSKTLGLLMYANSCGDVYAQAMKRRQQTESDKRTTALSDTIMEEFANELCELKPPPLYISDIVDMKEMCTIFNCERLSNKEIKQEVIEIDGNQQQEFKHKINDSEFKRTKGRWCKSMATLHSYKDALAPDLLSIWDIPYEEESDLKYSEVRNKFKEENSEKYIENWLNRNEKIEPTTSIPISNLNMSLFDMEASGIEEVQAQSTQILTTDQYEITFLSNNSLLEESNEINTSSRIRPAKPKVAKPKKKYVKGF